MLAKTFYLITQTLVRIRLMSRRYQAKFIFTGPTMRQTWILVALFKNRLFFLENKKTLFLTVAFDDSNAVQFE